MCVSDKLRCETVSQDTRTSSQIQEIMYVTGFVYLHLYKKKDENRGYKNVTLRTIMKNIADKTVH